MLDPQSDQTVVDPKDAAEDADLRYVSDERPGILRKRAGKGKGLRPEEAAVLALLRARLASDKVS